MRTIMMRAIASILVAWICLVGFYVIDRLAGTNILSAFFWPVDNFVVIKKLQRDVALLVYGQMPPSFAPIQIAFFTVFWSVVLFILFSLLTMAVKPRGRE